MSQIKINTKISKHNTYFILREEFSIRVLLEKVCKCSMAHLAESGWSFYIALLPTASLAEKLIVGHEWHISSAIQKFVQNHLGMLNSFFFLNSNFDG